MIRPRRRLRLLTAIAATAVAITVLTPIAPVAAEGEVIVDETVIAAGSVWSYLDDGTDPGTNWNTATYDDATWQTGNGQFGYGDGDETTTINYGPDPDNKYATTYFRKTIHITDAHQIINTTANLTYDDGAAIYLNGTRVLRTANLPEGFTSTTWANANAEETIPVAIDSALLVEGQNIIAVEIHQAWRKSNDVSFDLDLTISRNDAPKPPTVADDSASTNVEVAVAGDIALNDEAGLAYSTTAVVDAAVGAFVLNGDGTWSLTPAPGYFGLIVIPHTACDAANVCSDAQLTIEVISSIVQDQLVAAGSVWSYLDDGTDPGATWNTATYDDATWQTGNGQFGYGDGDETTTINYGPDPDNKYATTYFRKTIHITDSHQIINTTANLTYDDGAAIYLNGDQIYNTGNLPAGFGHTSWANANAEETIGFSIDPALLLEGDNTLAVEVHQAWRKSNDVSFDLSLTADRDDIPKPPTVADDSAETDEGVAVGGNVAANDEPGLTYSTTAVIDPAEAAFVLSGDGTWSLTPAAGYLGTITIPHTACDGANVCSQAELVIVVDVVGELTTEQLVDTGSLWSYLDDGTNPGPSWNSATYDDASWQTGNGQFGYGDGDETTTINYGPDPDNKYPTTYFRKTIHITSAYQLTQVAGSLTYDDAAAIYLNGDQIYNTGNLPVGFDHTTWAASGAEETISFSIDPSLLLEGDNTLAVEVHQVWRKSVDVSFDLAVEATRHVLPGPPAPTVIGDLAITPPGVAVAGDVAANDRANDAGSLIWSIDSLDLPDVNTIGSLVFNTDGTFQFTPAPGFAGTLTVPYLACNAGACSEAVLTIVVIDGNPQTPGAATIVDPGNQTLLIGLPIDLVLSASPAIDGTATVLTVQGLPAGLTVDGAGRITGTPTTAGTYPVNLYLTAAADSSYATVGFDVVVDDSALVSNSLGLSGPIHIIDPADAQITVDQPVDLPIDFQVSDGTFVYQWLPPGLTGTIDGHIVGTATETGAWTSEIALIDLAGNLVETTMVISVIGGPPAGIAAEHPAIDPLTLDLRPEPGHHGVLGFNVNDSSVADVRVWDMQQIGDHLYVGGEFQQVQLGENGAIVDQAFLARFDIDTGHYDPSFTPALDGNVHALELAPRGVLLVGGEFTAIDGVANTSGLAAIDPTTGQVDTSFRASVERPWSDNNAIVRELEVVGDLVYVVGNFSHLRDNLTNKRERFYRAARVGADFGEIDLTWLPEVAGGSVYGLSIDQDRGRVLLTGSFSSVAATAGTTRVAVVDSVIGGVIPHTMPATAWTVFDVEYANDLIFLANGWNNQITVHNADDFSLLYQHQSDGDFQFLEKIGDYVYAGCHCTQDPQYPTARLLDAHTGLEVAIALNLGGNIDGAWSVATDDRGCAWIGGDIWDGGFDVGTVWARGFARFCADD